MGGFLLRETAGVILLDINRTLTCWNGYFKDVRDVGEVVDLLTLSANSILDMGT